ncbi:MAG TPA: iron-containing redox enzyme family protein [Myxococcaceae bacterium]|jgi:pyrroloquinoline quinone (PQQ) biosynthesis protein C
MSQKFSEALRDEIAPLWMRMLGTRVYRALMSDDPVGKELLAIYLVESYHYAKHNAQHQALAVWRAELTNRDFMRAALQHAIEEVDHDQLALRDLERMGYDRAAVERSVPLPETQGFTGFLYHSVTRENPIGRLGYSLWAEGTQEIGPGVIARLKSKFGIKDNKEISFFAAHAVLDMRHGQEARDNIDRFAVTPEDRQAVRTVATTSLKLFSGVLEAMYDHYEDVKQGAPLIRAPLPA